MIPLQVGLGALSAIVKVRLTGTRAETA